MGTYAAKTTVPVEKSKGEIERTLTRYGAEGFAYSTGTTEATIGFIFQGRMVRLKVPLPSREDPKFLKTPSGRFRQPSEKTRDAAFRAWELACRQSWRALALAIKAKLEAVECGIFSFEEEFLSHMVLPNGNTFAEWAVPQLDEARTRMPHKLLAKHAG